MHPASWAKIVCGFGPAANPQTEELLDSLGRRNGATAPAMQQPRASECVTAWVCLNRVGKYKNTKKSCKSIQRLSPSQWTSMSCNFWGWFPEAHMLAAFLVRSGSSPQELAILVPLTIFPRPELWWSCCTCRGCGFAFGSPIQTCCDFRFWTCLGA
jgi:hypothetical protein